MKRILFFFPVLFIMGCFTLPSEEVNFDYVPPVGSDLEADLANSTKVSYEDYKITATIHFAPVIPPDTGRISLKYDNPNYKGGFVILKSQLDSYDTLDYEKIYSGDAGNQDTEICVMAYKYSTGNLISGMVKPGACANFVTDSNSGEALLEMKDELSNYVDDPILLYGFMTDPVTNESIYVILPRVYVSPTSVK